MKGGRGEKGNHSEESRLWWWWGEELVEQERDGPAQKPCDADGEVLVGDEVRAGV